MPGQRPQRWGRFSGGLHFHVEDVVSERISPEERDRLFAEAAKEHREVFAKLAEGEGWPPGYFESWEAITFDLPPREAPGAFEARMDRIHGEDEAQG